MKKFNFLAGIILTLVIVVYSAKPDWVATTGGPTGPINSIIPAANYLYASSRIYGPFLSTDHGNTWIDRSPGLQTLDIISTLSDGTTTFTASEDAGVFTSTNDGGSWSKSRNGFGNLIVNSMVTSNGKVYAGVDGADIYFTSNHGTQWKSINDGTVGHNVLSMAVSGNKLLVGTGNLGGGVYETTNDGNTWTDLNTKGQIPSAWSVQSIAINGNKYYAGTDKGGIYFSADAGNTWTTINNGLKSTNITAITVSNNRVFISTLGGVFFSDNDGGVWVDITDSLPEKNIMSLASDNTYLCAGTSNSSIWRRKLSDITFPDVQPPVLIAPVNNAQNVDTTLTLNWNSSNGAVSYDVVVAKDVNFQNVVNGKDGTNNLVFTLPVLEKGVTYYWKVAANTVDNQKKWSDVWQFTVKDQQTKPIPVYPMNKDTGITVPVTFSWNKARGTETYQLLISLTGDSTFNENIIETHNGLIDTFYVDNNLLVSTTYYWVVASVGPNNDLMMSDTLSFKTGIKVYVDDNNSNMGISAICTPNPASSQIDIDLSVMNDGNVSVQLFDILGNNVADIFDGFIDGKNRSHFVYNTVNLSSGFYRVVITSGKKTLSLPIIIAK